MKQGGEKNSALLWLDESESTLSFKRGNFKRQISPYFQTRIGKWEDGMQAKLSQ